MKAFKNQSQKGFTLVEMLVVAPIVILAIGAFLTAIIGMTGEVLASRASNNLSYNVQDALNHIEQDIKLSNGFLGANTVLGTDQGYNNDMTGFTNIGANGTSLILNAVATTSNPVSSSSSYVYLKNKPNDCTAPQGNTPFTYNIVYFVKNSTLYRRTLMPTTYNDTNVVCNVPWQQPSCLPTYMDNPAANFCKTSDITLVSGVAPEDFLVQYYNGENTTTINSTASTDSSASNRTTAMQAATTVGVTISAKQTAAGRDVARVASLRASRLDTNASSIGVITSDTALPAPKVSATVSEPTKITAKWGKVAGATSYTFEYQINGGGWSSSSTSGFNSVISNATHKDVVNIRVTATNGTINSIYGTTSLTVPLWTPIALQNGWNDYSPPFTSAAYTKTSTGLVVLKGMIKAGSTTIIGTLPVGYRPAGCVMYSVSSNSAVGRMDVCANGIITMSVGSSAWISLDGISFMPSSATFTSPTFLNGWLNYSPGSGDPNWQGAGYLTDSLGRVVTTGLIRTGTVAAGTPMFNLPAGSRPTDYMHILNDINGTGGNFRINNAGDVLSGGGGNTYVSLQEIFYPSGRATGTTCTTQWCALPLANGWNYYAASYSTPQYTKASDGLVTLKGLIKGGSSATAVIATLPAPYCPSEQLLLSYMNSSAVWSRLDIVRNSDGTCYLLPGTGTTVGLQSLDNVSYMADQ